MHSRAGQCFVQQMPGQKLERELRGLVEASLENQHSRKYPCVYVLSPQPGLSHSEAVSELSSLHSA